MHFGRAPGWIWGYLAECAGPREPLKEGTRTPAYDDAYMKEYEEGMYGRNMQTLLRLVRHAVYPTTRVGRRIQSLRTFRQAQPSAMEVGKGKKEVGSRKWGVGHLPTIQ